MPGHGRGTRGVARAAQPAARAPASNGAGRLGPRTARVIPSPKFQLRVHSEPFFDSELLGRRSENGVEPNDPGVRASGPHTKGPEGPILLWVPILGHGGC